MNNIFYKEGDKNFFDNLTINVDKIYKEFSINKKNDPKLHFIKCINNNFHKIYRNSIVPLKYRNKLWHLFKQINLDLNWFNEFKSYWSIVLGGRPLIGVQDFYFLKNLYRVKFQNNQVLDTKNSHTHLEAWQRPELIYQLLHLVFRESIDNQLVILNLLNKYKKKN